MIYLDNCATTPLDPVVAQRMHEVNLEVFGNPSSIHSEGRRAAKILGEARRIIADSIHAQPAEIVFTSSGTEANNLALSSTICHFRNHGPVHVIATSVEHASVAKRLAFEQRLRPGQLDITYLPVTGDGLVDTQQLRSAVREDTRLITLLHCNNETGVLQDLDAILNVKLSFPRVLLHLDIVQSYGKLPFDVRTMPVDFLTTCAHKLHGPKGVGFLFVRNGVEVEPLIVGGGQEKFRRAGTENIASIAGYAEAVKQTPPDSTLHRQLAALETAFLDVLNRAQISYSLNGPEDQARRMAGIFNLSMKGITNKEDLQIALDLEGVQVSSTSACHSGVLVDSPVLIAMGVEASRRAGSIRIGMSRMLTVEQVVQAALVFVQVVQRLTRS